MRIFFRLSLTAIAFLFFYGAFAAVETRAQGVLNEVVRRMDNNNKSLQSLRADVYMEMYNAQLDDNSDNKSGKVSYYFHAPKKARYVRIDWTKPVEEQLAVINKEYMIYTPRQARALCGSTDTARGSGGVGNPLKFMNMSKTELKANYSLEYVGQEAISGAVQTWHIRLTPKTSANYKVADLWVDSDGMPRQMKITASNNDTTTVLLSSIEKNPSLNAQLFTIQLPKNVKCTRG